MSVVGGLYDFKCGRQMDQGFNCSLILIPCFGPYIGSHTRMTESRTNRSTQITLGGRGGRLLDASPSIEEYVGMAPTRTAGSRSCTSGSLCNESNGWHIRALPHSGRFPSDCTELAPYGTFAVQVKSSHYRRNGGLNGGRGSMGAAPTSRLILTTVDGGRALQGSVPGAATTDPHRALSAAHKP